MLKAFCNVVVFIYGHLWACPKEFYRFALSSGTLFFPGCVSRCWHGQVICIYCLSLFEIHARQKVPVKLLARYRLHIMLVSALFRFLQHR